jgi:uncharacterized membrane protein
MTVLVLVLLLTGLTISIYFTGVYYHWFGPDVFWIPKVCRLEEKSCLLVLDTPRAKIFGIPNSAFGIGIYLYLMLDLFFFPPLLGFLLLAAALTRSIYLAYSLIFITKIPCVLCFTSHAVNLALFIIYLIQFMR